MADILAALTDSPDVRVFLICIAAFCAGCALLVGLCRAAGREAPEPPAEPEPVDPRDLCGKCPQRATTSIHGWPLCAEHAAEIHARAPFDREAS